MLVDFVWTERLSSEWKQKAYARTNAGAYAPDGTIPSADLPSSVHPANEAESNIKSNLNSSVETSFAFLLLMIRNVWSSGPPHCT